MKKMHPQRNDGWNDESYDFGRGDELNQKLGGILNEACHVFHEHAGGTWQSRDKDYYARQLIDELRAHPSLIGQLKQLEDRVVMMVVYRAIEIMKEEDRASSGKTEATDTSP
jgi:hypothetical protein